MLLVAVNRNSQRHSQLVVTTCASLQPFYEPTLRAHLSLMGFYILRSMSATLFAFLVVMCATPASCQQYDKERGGGAQFAAAEEAVTRAEAATSRVIDSGLVLVRAGSPGVLRFDHFQALQAGMAAPLTCNASHPGNGIGTKYPEERMFGEWRYTESKMVAAQNACMAQLVQGKFIKRVDANLVLDVAFWVFQEGTAVNWVGGVSDSRTYLNGGGRDFRVNPDGSISLVNHPHLALGVCGPNDCWSDADVFFIFVVVPLAVALIGTLGGVYGCYRCKCCRFQGHMQDGRGRLKAVRL